MTRAVIADVVTTAVRGLAPHAPEVTDEDRERPDTAPATLAAEE